MTSAAPLRTAKGQFLKGTHYRPHRVFREKNYLIHQYVTLHRSAHHIAKEHNVTPCAITFWLRRHNIPIRSGSDCTKANNLGWQSKDLNEEEKREYQRLWRLAFPRPSQRKFVSQFDRQRRKMAAEERKKTAMKIRRQTNVNVRLASVLRTRVGALIKGRDKSTRTLTLLGCSIESFKIYLESRWQSGMSWENYGRGPGKWNIDHEMPCAIFDLTKPEHQKRCFHFSNCQPMWSLKNSEKNAKVLTNQFNLL